MVRRDEAGIKQRIAGRSGKINHATPPRVRETAKTGAADTTPTCIVSFSLRLRAWRFAQANPEQEPLLSGFASNGLEDGCLMYSTTAAF